MSNAFVLINEPVHRLLRKLTREVPLTPVVLPEGGIRMGYRPRGEDVPEFYYRLASLHALQGLPLPELENPSIEARVKCPAWVLERVGYFDSVRLDRRCSRDLRLKYGQHRSGLVGGELLTYGAGTLRARNDDHSDRLQAWLWSRYGRIETRHEVVFARIGALHWNSAEGELGKEHFDSTNLVYGDAFGEVEQLWERRADTDFLEEVVHELGELHRRRELAAFVQPPRNLSAILGLHLRAQAVWRRPPSNARSLLRRIEYVLSRTFIENSPETVLVGGQCAPMRPEPASQGRSVASEWQADVSGYDGWLAA